MENFTNIQNYILFLRQKGYNVSFSDFGDNFHPYTEKMLQHEIHLHSVCSYLKSNPQTVGMCSNAKKKLSACKINHPVYSCCYAGVEEYIYPVFKDGKRIICIHISGYRNNLNRSKRQKQKTENLCSDIYSELYNLLSTEKPTICVVESFIKPLIYMITTLYEECKEFAQKKSISSPTTEIYLAILKNINDNYMNDISAGSIAKELGYSASYIRAVFKKESEFSLQNRINDIRLQNAEFLLKNTALSITDISFQCGFNDSNYFSVIFKKKYTLSPLQYKKKQS